MFFLRDKNCQRTNLTPLISMSSPARKGSVFDRLYDTRSYTGVYAERFKGADGRINAHTDLSVLS